MEEINKSFLVELMVLLDRYNANIDSKEFGPMMQGIEIEVSGDRIKFNEKIDKLSILRKIEIYK